MWLISTPLPTEISACPVNTNNNIIMLHLLSEDHISRDVIMVIASPFANTTWDSSNMYSLYLVSQIPIEMMKYRRRVKIVTAKVQRKAESFIFLA